MAAAVLPTPTAGKALQGSAAGPRVASTDERSRRGVARLVGASTGEELDAAVRRLEAARDDRSTQTLVLLAAMAPEHCTSLNLAPVLSRRPGPKAVA